MYKFYNKTQNLVLKIANKFKNVIFLSHPVHNAYFVLTGIVVVCFVSDLSN